MLAERHRRRERCICPVCGRKVRAGLPRGGDGSAMRVAPHFAFPEWRRRCSGSWLSLEAVDEDGYHVALRGEGE